MPIRSVIDQNLQILFRYVVGLVTPEESIMEIQNAGQIPGFHPDMPVIWDLCESQVTNTTSSDLIRLAEFVNHQARERGDHYKVAIVAPSDLGYGLGRIYAAYSTGGPQHVQVFRTTEEAISWIRGTSDHLQS